MRRCGRGNRYDVYPHQQERQGYDRVYQKMYTYLMILSSFRSQIIRKSAYVNAYFSILIISCPDSQSQFQMFTLFSGRHIGVPRRYTSRQFCYFTDISFMPSKISNSQNNLSGFWALQTRGFFKKNLTLTPVAFTSQVYFIQLHERTAFRLKLFIIRCIVCFLLFHWLRAQHATCK